MAGINAAGELAPEAEALSVTTWQGPVEITRSARIPVSAFAEQLLSEPEQEPDGELSALSPQPSALVHDSTCCNFACQSRADSHEAMTASCLIANTFHYIHNSRWVCAQQMTALPAVHTLYLAGHFTLHLKQDIPTQCDATSRDGKSTNLVVASLVAEQ